MRRAGALLAFGAALSGAALAPSARAQDFLSPGGRADARAGAGLAAGDDAFSATRNPASIARFRDPLVEAGARAAVWALEQRGVLVDDERHVVGAGAPGFAAVLRLDGARPTSARRYGREPLRAGLAGWQDALEGEGRIEARAARKPGLLEVRARGAAVALSEIRVEARPDGEAGALVGVAAADEGKPEPADFAPVLSANRILRWPRGPAIVTVLYKWRFLPGDRAGDALDVRLDLDGAEAARGSHARPATGPVAPPETPAAGSDGPALAEGGGNAGGADPGLVRRLDEGVWRLGIAVTPALFSAGEADAPAADPSGWRLTHVLEAATAAIARRAGGFAFGVAGHVYGGGISGLEMPAVVPKTGGGDQVVALSIARAATVGVGASLGATANCPACDLTVGLHYATRSFLGSYRGDADTDGLTIPGSPFGPVSGGWQAAIRGLRLPDRAGLGLAWRPLGGDVLLAADVVWWDWSSVANDLKIVLDDPSSFAAAATNSGTVRIEVPLNWEDQWVLTAGASVRLHAGLLVHAGYAYTTNPYPGPVTHPLLPAVAHHRLAAGLTIKVGPLTGTLAYHHGFRESARVSGARSLDGSRLAVTEHAASLTAGVGF